MEKFTIWYSIVPILRCTFLYLNIINKHYTRWLLSTFIIATIMFITLSYTHVLLYCMFWYLGLIFDDHCLIHLKCTWRNELPCLFSLAIPKRTNNLTWKCTKVAGAFIVIDIKHFDINLCSQCWYLSVSIYEMMLM